MTSSRRADTRAPARAQAGAARAKAAAARAAVEVPTITYPAELPVSARRQDIAAAIRDHQVVIVAGETGSGKTTQIPKIALELGRGRAGQIGHTQPRRIAARSVADRIAEELGTTLGDVVGYQVRFTDTSSERTLVKVMTDGILLAQIQRDPDLLTYDTLIIDEAHERSLNIDVLLGYLTNLLPRRPDLKIIITSATIDSERFARHFAPGGPIPDDAGASGAGAGNADADTRPTAPVIQVTGRTYPVEMRYRPLTGETRGEERDLMTGVTDACDELMREGPGDILVFFSGEREIRDAVDALEGHLGPRVRDPKHPQAVEILPLYARLSSAEQHRVFAQHSRRRIVLATNVAETSLTVPGIHYVVDPGTARISRYSKATKVQRLPIEPISQASANQRAGRAGRLADGIAIRLYAQDDFESRPDFTEPEILRTSLASVLLQMISVGVVSTPDDVASFPFVEPPDTRSIKDGIQLLSDLGAVTSNRGGKTRLTDVGRKLARLPIDPRQARMIVEGERHGVAYEAAVIAAALSIQDPRERPSDKRAEADLQHRRFSTPTSDLLGYLNLWAYLRDRQHELSGSAFRRMCRSEFLNYLRVREWQDLVQQLRQAAKPVGIHIKARAATPVGSDGGAGGGNTVAFLHTWNEDAIHRSVLAGLLTQIGVQDESKVTASSYSHLRGEAKAIAMKRARKRATNEFLGTRGARFAIQPGSPLSKKPPAFVMAAQLVETNRLWARDVARIDPAWAEELAGDLAKHTYSEPHWSTKQGAAMAHEKVLLYGVPIVAERRVLWGKINPAEARELFIRNALVQGEWTTHHEFWKANQSALADAADVEARTRTFGLVAGEEELFDFYDERIPDHIVSASHFDRWWKGARRDSPDLLTYTNELLMPEAADVDPSLFPDTWPQGEFTLPLTYQFEPGADADGVTVHIPLAVLPRVTPDGFDWLVPGMLPELTTATIRALPKPVRRLLVPAPDAARDIVAWMARNAPAWEDLARAGDMAESFRDAFARATRELRDAVIPADAWDEVDGRLASHLKMTFRIVEHKNGRESVVAESTHLLALKRSLAPQTADAVRRAVGAAPDADRKGKVSASAAPKPSPATFAGGPVVEKGELATWPPGLPGGALPEVIESDVGGGVIVRGYPGIVEEKGGAALRILADARERDAVHADGVRRLLLTECGLATKRVTSRWTSAQSLALAASGYRTTDALVADLQLTAIRALTTVTLTTAGGDAVDAAAVRSADAYAAARDHVRDRLEDEIHRLVGLVVPIVEASRALDGDIRATTSMALLSTLADVRALASNLAGDGFLSRTPPDRLRHVPRYLKAARHRIEKAPSQPARDAELAWRVREIAEELDREGEAAAGSIPDAARAARIDTARWMIQEFRVSLFAQQLGTDGPVSEKRIRGVLVAPAT